MSRKESLRTCKNKNYHSSSNVSRHSDVPIS